MSSGIDIENQRSDVQSSDEGISPSLSNSSKEDINQIFKDQEKSPFTEEIFKDSNINKKKAKQCRLDSKICVVLIITGIIIKIILTIIITSLFFKFHEIGQIIKNQKTQMV